MSSNLSSKSANSDSKSKRSFNSMSPNPSASNNSGQNKKKKTSQKTLGMAWGPNSRSSSRSTSRRAPFSNFGSYMETKNQKLHEQFDAEASSSSRSDSSCGKRIFRGVSIFVDGYTIPSSQELRGYMLKYGGRFENYFSRHCVTHIICSNLPDSKIKNLRSFSGGLPVVQPTWILDSVAADRLLNWVPYQLDQLATETNGQPKLSSFFTAKSSPTSDDEVMCVADQEVSESENRLIEDGMYMEANYSEEFGKGQDCSAHVNSFQGVDEPSCSRGDLLEEVEADGNCISVGDASILELQDQSITCQDPTTVLDDCLDNQNKESSTSKAAMTSSPRHSTLTDSNFVENYFKSSRLHFIGTWRTRYRKRFPGLSGGLKWRSSSFSSMYQKMTIIHVDMDCFFVAVVIRKHPELRDKPVAVCHSDNPRGTAEISSANYPARDYGVKAGMFVRDAKARCPHLIIFPYDFNAYEEVADQFYNILHKHCNRVQAVSCDEAFVDVTDSSVEDPQLLASIIRKEISDTTGCTASAGIAGNMLMARLGTRLAKPDGQCFVPPEKVDEFLHDLPVKALPGIGHVLEEKLKRRQIRTCGQLRTISKELLQKDFGLKTGEMLWNSSRGIDNRLVGVIQESKSIGAEVNWGVRFNDLSDAQHFLVKLSKEVALRLQGCGVQGRSFTLKIKKRKFNAGEPIKYLGCGDCDNLSHSVTVPVATDDADVLQRITSQLFGSFQIDVKDIRGMGLQVTKLEDANDSKQGLEKSSIRSWLLSASAKTKDQLKIGCSSEIAPTGDCQLLGKNWTEGNKFNLKRLLVLRNGGLTNMSCTTSFYFRVRICGAKTGIDGDSDLFSSDSAGPSSRSAAGSRRDESGIVFQNVALPPLHDLDLGVLMSLPPEVFSEINDMYGGKLLTFISKSKGKSKEVSDRPTMVPESAGGVTREDNGPIVSFLEPYETKEASDRDVLGKTLVKASAEEKREEENKSGVLEIKLDPVSGGETSNMGVTDTFSLNINLMPSSLSQVDTSVLEQLPEDLRTDILQLLPAHRMGEAGADVSLNVENQTEHQGSASSNDLWVGSPPCWIDKFKASNCRMLNMFVELYLKAGSSDQLSSILQRAMQASFDSDASPDASNAAASSMCELLLQYVNLKIETDIEEIYVCSRLLRRLSARSKIFAQLYDIFLPHLQASVGEIYGGSLQIFP